MVHSGFVSLLSLLSIVQVQANTFGDSRLAIRERELYARDLGHDDYHEQSLERRVKSPRGVQGRKIEKSRTNSTPNLASLEYQAAAAVGRSSIRREEPFASPRTQTGIGSRSKSQVDLAKLVDRAPSTASNSLSHGPPVNSGRTSGYAPDSSLVKSATSSGSDTRGSDATSPLREDATTGKGATSGQEDSADRLQLSSRLRLSTPTNSGRPPTSNRSPRLFMSSNQGEEPATPRSKAAGALVRIKNTKLLPGGLAAQSIAEQMQAEQVRRANTPDPSITEPQMQKRTLDELEGSIRRRGNRSRQKNKNNNGKNKYKNQKKNNQNKKKNKNNSNGGSRKNLGGKEEKTDKNNGNGGKQKDLAGGKEKQSAGGVKGLGGGGLPDRKGKSGKEGKEGQEGKAEKSGKDGMKEGKGEKGDKGSKDGIKEGKGEKGEKGSKDGMKEGKGEKGDKGSIEGKGEKGDKSDKNSGGGSSSAKEGKAEKGEGKQKNAGDSPADKGETKAKSVEGGSKSKEAGSDPKSVEKGDKAGKDGKSKGKSGFGLQSLMDFGQQFAGGKSSKGSGGGGGFMNMAQQFMGGKSSKGSGGGGGGGGGGGLMNMAQGFMGSSTAAKYIPKGVHSFASQFMGGKQKRSAGAGDELFRRDSKVEALHLLERDWDEHDAVLERRVSVLRPEVSTNSPLGATGVRTGRVTKGGQRGTNEKGNKPSVGVHHHGVKIPPSIIQPSDKYGAKQKPLKSSSGLESSQFPSSQSLSKGRLPPKDLSVNKGRVQKSKSQPSLRKAKNGKRLNSEGWLAHAQHINLPTISPTSPLLGPAARPVEPAAAPLEPAARVGGSPRTWMSSRPSTGSLVNQSPRFVAPAPRYGASPRAGLSSYPSTSSFGGYSPRIAAESPRHGGLPTRHSAGPSVGNSPRYHGSPRVAESETSSAASTPRPMQRTSRSARELWKMGEDNSDSD